ncbi:MAG TPA: tripartite tricarboxylate transporter substrate-binding protein [Xanthobacteraceae bacterium]|jgi:tripartite-type tricarboxylate transporter receptor subunit TctC|nr:tripartite tricarboxylate transporter substrate-binding protein [Xanthobacteraceae bacterium]
MTTTSTVSTFHATLLNFSWRHLAVFLGIAAVTMPSGVAAQAYPDKPIKIISPFSAGSAPDALGRLVAQRLSERVGQSITIENRPGAGTTIATKAAASATADGYTLLQVNAALAFSTIVYPNAGYDPLKSFAPVATFAGWSHLLLVSSSVPASSLAELVAYAKANPNQVNIGFPLGQPPQVLAEKLKQESGASFTSVPYRQISQLMADVLAGRVQAFFGAGAAVMPLIQQGRLKAIAYTGASRYAALPQVPTVAEGGLPQLALNPSDWTGLVTPSGTPTDAIDRLNAAINASLASPDVRASIEALGGEARPMQPQEFATFLASETRKWGPLVKQAGLTPD